MPFISISPLCLSEAHVSKNFARDLLLILILLWRRKQSISIAVTVPVPSVSKTWNILRS